MPVRVPLPDGQMHESALLRNLPLPVQASHAVMKVACLCHDTLQICFASNASFANVRHTHRQKNCQNPGGSPGGTQFVNAAAPHHIGAATDGLRTSAARRPTRTIDALCWQQVKDQAEKAQVKSSSMESTFRKKGLCASQPPPPPPHAKQCMPRR